MKISAAPVLEAPSSTPQESKPNIYSLKMRTDVTPGPARPPEISQELPISDNNKTEATVEATQPLSPQFAELARRRRSLQVKERELADKIKAFEAASQKGDVVEISRIKERPLETLLEHGVTYEQLTEAVLASQGNAEVNALKAEISALKGEIDKKFIDRETQAEQQVLAEMRREANLLVSQSKDFELVKETRSVPDVMRLIEQNYRQTGEVLDVREALSLVENELFKDAQRLMNTGKIKSQFSSQAPQIPQPQQRPGIRTLTNKHTASVPMSAKERALAAFYGTLKR